MSSERPAKRVRQACEPCRRKKSRCPGEKPICSHCARLRQNCYYADDVHHTDNERAFSVGTPTLQPRSNLSSANERRLEDRLNLVESQLAEVLANHGPQSRPPSRPVPDSPVPVTQGQRSQLNLSLSNGTLPSWEIATEAAENYLLFCDCQPLPLFHRPSFIHTLRDRDPEILFSILASSLRFSGSPAFHDRQPNVDTYVEAARTIVSKRVFEGTVELSTIQTLCLLSLVDFTNGNTRRASIHSSLAMNLAHNAGLTSESYLPLDDKEKEERRRCFWSLFMVKRLHGADFSVLDFTGEENFPWYPETTGAPLNPERHPQRNDSIILDDDISADKGIVAYALQLSEVWFKITRYARRRGKPSNLPPWSPQSEYSTILAQQMDFETRMPYIYRFKPAKFSQRSAEELHENRDFWGPWLFTQIVYHTNLCLLNHPLLISLRLRNFKSMIPEIFLQHTSDLISSHASWIIHFIDMLESKPFRVTDPFLGHCVAIVATIYLQESFVVNPVTRREKEESFNKCLAFVRGLGEEWPHLSRIGNKLQNLGETVSATYVAGDINHQTPSRRLLIDLGQFWEILEYSSSSEIPGLANQLFGPSLHSAFRGSTTEIAQTSALPEPTPVDKQDFSNSVPNSVRNSVRPEEGLGDLQFGEARQADVPFIYNEDELAVLAESFFQQRGEFDGNVDNWWNTGKL